MTNHRFEALLDESVKIHGHLCPGQVLGVRMAMHGLRQIGIEDPKGKDRKKLYLFVEIDRCATDALQSVTGCSLGHRTMRFVDYGKMAATFVNLATNRSVRVVAREEAKEKARTYVPEIGDKYRCQVEAYKIMPDAELFDDMEVRIDLKPEDMPGRPLRRVRCASCGEYVQDSREVRRNGDILCRRCAQGGYYTVLQPEGDGFLLPGVAQKSHSGIEIRSKLWIEVEGEPVFGRGRRFLLEAIDRYGSINQAAKGINISYRKAWSYIKAMEERLGIRLVERQAGGRNGGGAALTSEARHFIRRFEMLDTEMAGRVDERFHEIFPK
jgi:formylmethanofuran dehydrogenase subunit E